MREDVETQKKLFSEIALAPGNRRAFSFNGKESIPLNPQEFRLLVVLKKKEGKIAAYQEMIDFLYGEPEGDLPLSDILSVKVTALRKKLEESSEGRFGILAVEGMGYQLTDTLHPELLSSITARAKNRNGERRD